LKRYFPTSWGTGQLINKKRRMNRGRISNILRKLKVLYFFDWLHFVFQKIIFRKVNRNFMRQYPEVILPTDYMMYESFQLNYKKYYFDGIESAEWLTGHLMRYRNLVNLKILDWGCGPGRIIRHLPDFTGTGCEFYATDYNQKTIDWCKTNLHGISFNKNSLEANLPYKDDFFDFIFGLSVFTHLSEEKHIEWFDELYRILKPGGILFVTTQGRNFICKLTESEKVLFEKGDIVVRGKVKEGHRTYSAFHPKDYMFRLFGKAEILAHIEQEPGKGKGIPQDIWIVRK
jgi:SAM-dependent methyltransferase